MILIVESLPILKGSIQLPASKSYSIRAFMISACGGKSVIIDPSDCDDALVAMRTVKKFGVKIKKANENTWEIDACKALANPSQINVKESGTVLRFVLPLLALRGKAVEVLGEGTLIGRPNVFLNQSLRDMGVNIQGTGKQESVPINISKGDLNGGTVVIDGSISSQFISALLIICPQLEEDTRLKLKGKKLVSTDYITMTLQVLEKSGICIEQRSAREYFIKGHQKFKGLKKFIVPSDYGLAAFPMAAAILGESNVTLKGHIKDDLIQADGQIIPLLKRMGAAFKQTSRSIKIKGPQNLKGGQFSLKDCPDLVPIMAILTFFAKGKTRLYNIAHARVKESDRISDLRKELLKIGADVTETENELIIDPKKAYHKNCLLDPHHDHRLAMAFCVLGTKLGVRIKDIQCTAKSYPSFVDDFKMLGVKLFKS